MNKKTKTLVIIFSILIILLLLSLLLFSKKNNYKNNKSGNNKNIEEIEQYILNIKTYNATLDVTITNNRNENYYKLKQEVTENYEKQITEEPEEIQGLEMTFKDGKIEIKNTKLNLSKIYENYSQISENNLFLSQFIESYKNGSEKNIKNETENEVILEVKTNKNRYNITQKLYVNSKTLKPEKLEILDDNNNTRVYILYSEIEINI